MGDMSRMALSVSVLGALTLAVLAGVGGWRLGDSRARVTEGSAVVTNVNGDDTGVVCMEVSGALRVDGKDFVCGKGYMTGGGAVDQSLTGARVHVERMDGLEREGNQVYLLRPAR